MGNICVPKLLTNPIGLVDMITVTNFLSHKQTQVLLSEEQMFWMAAGEWNWSFCAVKVEFYLDYKDICSLHRFMSYHAQK